MLEDATTSVPAVLRRTLPKSKIRGAVPAFNEGPTIGSVVLKARQFASDVVVVDDGSTDDTAETAALAGAHVIQHARNLGKGLAIRSAWLYARERAPQAFVLLDGDHQHDPDDIPRLVETILAGKSDVVIGVRWGKTSGMPIHRRIGKRVLDYATAAARPQGLLTDSQSGYRVVSRRALFALELAEGGLWIESQMLVEAQQKNMRIEEVRVDFQYDVDGSPLPAGRHGMQVLGRVIALVSSQRPLFFFGIPGGLSVLVGLVLGVNAIFVYSLTGAFAIGYVLLSMLLLLVGITSIFAG